MANVKHDRDGSVEMGEAFWERVVEMRERSGSENSDDRLVVFLYLLMRDHLPSGAVEDVMNLVEGAEVGTVTQFTNGWMARHAKDVATRLVGD